jgi:putative ABC transport system permease protein
VFQRTKEALLLALQVPIRNPGRSALTALGLAIGVGAFIAMVSFGRGARTSVVSQFEALGSNLLKIRNQSRGDGTSATLQPADVAALRREGTTLEHIVPFAATTLVLSYGGRTHRTVVRGATPEFAKVRDEPVTLGGLFDEVDMAERAKVCVLGYTPMKQLFGNEDPLGAVVTLGGNLPCRVIGVLSARGTAVSGSDLDDRVMIPLTTYESHLGISGGYSWLEVRPSQPSLMGVARTEITDILRRSHHLAEGAGDDFRIESPDEVTKVAEQIGGIMTGLLAGIALVSLLVGGIGIMNIQLVSVAERTHEIGVRAAIGASPSQILRQFLAEALVLATIGVSVGVGLGVTVSVLVSRQMGWHGAVLVDTVIGAALFGVFVGTLFGYIPAKRAADMDPIDALRRE